MDCDIVRDGRFKLSMDRVMNFHNCRCRFTLRPVAQSSAREFQGPQAEIFIKLCITEAVNMNSFLSLRTL